VLHPVRPDTGGGTNRNSPAKLKFTEMKKTYFIGVYRDYTDKTNTCQVSDGVDGLNCEILAEPGVIEFTGSANNGMTAARLVAKKYGCKFLEWNCSGRYELIQLVN
jgi:hypothetical protein